MSALVHWRRPLKDGEVEFQIIVPAHMLGLAAIRPLKVSGATDPAGADVVVEAIERLYGVKLPEPEWKAPRGKWAT